MVTSSSSLTSLLTSDDTREAHRFLGSDQILNLIPLLRGVGCFHSRHPRDRLGSAELCTALDRVRNILKVQGQNLVSYIFKNASGCPRPSSSSLLSLQVLEGSEP